MDYRELEKTAQRDNFLLPHIDVIVDNTIRHAMFSFMNGFSCYNQIKIVVEYKKKPFLTPWGTFCFKVMLFGLENAGTTYQRAMTTLFDDMIHYEIDVYVDDMIAKPEEEEDHLVNLGEMFNWLRKYQLKLNPTSTSLGPFSVN